MSRSEHSWRNRWLRESSKIRYLSLWWLTSSSNCAARYSTKMTPTSTLNSTSRSRDKPSMITCRLRNKLNYREGSRSMRSCWKIRILIRSHNPLKWMATRMTSLSRMTLTMTNTWRSLKTTAPTPEPRKTFPVSTGISVTLVDWLEQMAAVQSV